MSRYEAREEALVNGVRIRYAVAGEGRSVLLVHGNGESHELFDGQIGQLIKAGYRVYAPDSRGHGASQAVREFHYADMAEDMFQLIRSLGLIKPAFYGHSDGGIIGLLLESTHPGTLGALAVSGANLSPAGLKKEFLAECEKACETSPDPLIALMLTEPHIDPEDLKKIRIPVLVTAGSRDLIAPEETRRIASHLPCARLVTVEGADHGSYIRGSGIMGRLLIDFLEEHPA